MKSFLFFLSALVFLPLGLRADPPALEPLTAAERGTPGIWDRAQLWPDPGGARAALADRGVTFTLFYTAEVFGNPVGGRRKGIVYDGLVEPSIDLDFEKLAGWKGLTFHVLAYYPHGASGTKKYVGDLGVFSNIEFYDSWRLFELWFEKSFTLPGSLGKFSIRAGLLAVDSEFANAAAATTFLNSNFGALPTFALNTPAPIYAYAAPGVRLRWEPNSAFYVQGAVYDGNPDPDYLGDPSPGSRSGTTYNRAGIRFNLNSKEGAFSIYEAGYLLNQGEGATGLPGAYRIGGFYHSDTFSDKRRDAAGRSLADPLSNRIPRARRGDYGFYFVAEQSVWQAPLHAGEPGISRTSPVVNSNAPPSGPSRPDIRLFLRLGAAPADRNITSFYVDTGVNFRGLFPSRPKDILGLAASYTKLSDRLRAFGRDTNAFTGSRTALPDYEAVLELSYQANATPWFQVQPDLQYIIHPGGSSALRNALVLGVRTVTTF